MNTVDHSLESALRRRRRVMLALLGLLFFAPLAVSFYMYYGTSAWRPRGNVSHGELISPARPLPQLPLPTPAGGQTEPRFLLGRWSLIYIGRLQDGLCDERCRKALYYMRQVRLSLNDKSERVQRVLLYSGSCCEQPFFSTEQAGLIAAEIDSAAATDLLRQFVITEASPVDGGRIYLTDPLGNLLMSYGQDAQPQEIREDLQRLLKLSHIG